MADPILTPSSMKEFIEDTIQKIGVAVDLKISRVNAAGESDILSVEEIHSTFTTTERVLSE